MQHLLRKARWNADAVRDDVRDGAVEQLGARHAVLVFDETGDLKKGSHTVGVQRQYTGTAGRIENAQVAVFATYATDTGHTLVDRELYLPRCWTEDPDRRHGAGVPDDVDFATKPQLATRMITQARQAGVPAEWVAADEVYGGNTSLRGELETQQLGYVLAVSCDHRVVTVAPSTRTAPSHPLTHTPKGLTLNTVAWSIWSHRWVLAVGTKGVTLVRSPQLGRYYEDFEVGEVYRHPLGRTISEADNTWFTLLTCNTNQNHFNAVYAGYSPVAGQMIVNSGLTVAIILGQSAIDVSQNAFANLGWDNIQLTHPVYVGDTLFSESLVQSKRDSNSRPYAGIVTCRTRGLNQHGDEVLSWVRSALIAKREAGTEVEWFPQAKSGPMTLES